MSDKDVRSIFQCLHDRGPVPDAFNFFIVPVGANGLKLSPPSYEFSVGLYVLLRPEKRSKGQKECEDVPQPPKHLEHLLLPTKMSETCPWSLSGPQFPQPTGIQQRYCYPKGSPGYSSQIGGALWTICGSDGKEDLEFRLLHVYFSAKRAVNKGVPPSFMEPPNNSRIKRRKPASERQHLEVSPPASEYHPEFSPAVTESSASQTSVASCPSPIKGFEDFENARRYGGYHDYYHHPHHQMRQTYHQSYQQHNYHHPATIDYSLGYPSHASNNIFRRYLPTDCHEASQYQRRHQPPLPPTQKGSVENTGFFLSSTGEGTAIRENINKSNDSADSKPLSVSLEPFELDVSLKDIDTYWNDPLVSIMLKPSRETTTSGANSNDGASIKGEDDETRPDERGFQRMSGEDRPLLERLRTLQLSIREIILQAVNQNDQESILATVTQWATELARDPIGIGDPSLSQQSKLFSITSSGGVAGN